MIPVRRVGRTRLVACVGLFALAGCSERSSSDVAHMDAATALPSNEDASQPPSAADIDAGDAVAWQPSDASYLDSALRDAGVGPDAKLAMLRPDAPTLCARPGDDAVRDLFCGASAPDLASLRDLQVRLSLNLIPADADEAQVLAYEPDPSTVTDQLVVLGHSTALAGQLVSPINPRIVLLGQQTFMAFQRGVQQVELAAFDREDHSLNLYLVTFRQACNAAAAGCLPGDLYTPDLERNWLSVQLEDDEDLKNTPSDCRQCHQRVRGRPLLLMRELKGPWTHFFAGRDDPATKAFVAAKQGELYGNIPPWAAALTAGGTLQNRVEAAQPLEFDTPRIEEELVAHDPATGPRRSPTWDRAYAAFKRGEQLPLPHYEPFPADAKKQEALSAAYQRYRKGELPKAQLPDLADIFPDDPKRRAEIGLQNEPDATPAEALIQVCGPCHNDALDQTLSRALFNISLSRMSRAELDTAISRLSQAPHTAGVMPPPETRQLDSAMRTRLIEYLRQTTRPSADDAMLDKAAKSGMAVDPWDGLIVDVPDTRDY
jgi:hypothetical protein